MSNFISHARTSILIFRNGLRRAFRDRVLPTLVRMRLHRIAEIFARGRVLNVYFHGVTDSPPNHTHMETEKFVQFLLYLKDTYEIIPLDRCSEHRGRAITVSFDDGYRNLMDVALPLCNSLKIPVTVFASPGLPDTSFPFMFKRLKYVTTGSHTEYHEDLTAIPLDKAQAAIVDSRYLGDTFCFPYARYTPELARIASEHYRMVFGNHPNGCGVIPRYCLSNTVPLHVLKAQVSYAFVKYSI